MPLKLSYFVLLSINLIGFNHKHVVVEPRALYIFDLIKGLNKLE